MPQDGEEFNKNFVENGVITNIWRNERSWATAKGIASYLSTLKELAGADIEELRSISEDDKTALRSWARNSSLKDWRENPIGAIRGVGLVTFQYLRMMGGIDTVMPDKIVKKVINGILRRAGLEPVSDDVEFVRKAEGIALSCGYRPIELCWMTWLIQPEGKMMRMEKYAGILPKI